MDVSDDSPQRTTWRDRFGRRVLGPGGGRRRLYLRVGIALMLVGVFIVLPGYVANQPRFLQRYPGLRGPYEAWSTSVHAQIRCQACHVAPGPLAQGVYGARMLGEFYLSLVMPARQPGLLSTPTNAACQSCHIDLRTVSPSGDLNIPHRAHVSVLKLKCVDCHTYLVHATNPEGTHTPRMVTCLKCHDGKKAKSACSTCHTNKRVPESHRAADWLVIHGTQQSKIDCTQCHKWTAEWCSECHSRRPRSHSKLWRTEHPAKVKLHRNCEVCHEGVFCVRCHGEVPTLNLDPALKIVR